MVELFELSEVTFETLRLCLIWVFFSLVIFGKFFLNFQWLVFLS